jgi:hypothetical protein
MVLNAKFQFLSVRDGRSTAPQSDTVSLDQTVVPDYRHIADYAIGDTHAAALIAADGSVDIGLAYLF